MPDPYDCFIQDSEEEVKMSCGCRLFRPYSDGVALAMCRVHREAVDFCEEEETDIA